MKTAHVCWRWWLLLGGLLILGSTASAQVAGWTNGGFEGNTFGQLPAQDWTTNNGSGSVSFSLVVPPSGENPGPKSAVYNGTRSFQANVTNAGGAGNYPRLSHASFTASSGSVYCIRFLARINSPNAVNRPSMKLHISSGSSPYDVLFTPSNFGYDEFRFAFKASGATTVSFTFEQAATFCLDDINVYDQTDAFLDVPATYLWQWGFQNYQANNSSATNSFSGADNDISAPLPDGRTAWLFNDSLVQRLDYTTDRRGGWQFPRNYVALQSVPGSTLDTSTFLPVPIAVRPSNSQWDGVFQPVNTPNSNNYTIKDPIYWPNDAIVDGNNLVVTLDAINNGGGAIITLATAAVPLSSLTGSSALQPTYTYRNWGRFLLDGGDGFIYIYDGISNGTGVARVGKGNLTDASQWRYWTGSGYTGTQSSQAVAVQGLNGGARSFERLGPNNYVALNNNFMSAQFASSPAGPWSNSQDVVSTPPTAGLGIAYMAYVHKQTVQNGVYSVGHCNFYDTENDNDGAFHPVQSKTFYTNGYLKTKNLLSLSPYTLSATASFAESFSNSYETVWWQNYGGAWTINGSVYSVNAGFTGFQSILKGVLRGDFTLEADVSCQPTSTGGYAGVILRGKDYAYGAGNLKGYSLLLVPGAANGAGARLVRNDGNGSETTLATSNNVTLNSGTGYHVKVVAAGNSLKAYINNSSTPQLSVTDGTYSSGGVGVRVYFSPNSAFDNFQVHQ